MARDSWQVPTVVLGQGQKVSFLFIFTLREPAAQRPQQRLKEGRMANSCCWAIQCVQGDQAPDQKPLIPFPICMTGFQGSIWGL